MSGAGFIGSGRWWRAGVIFTPYAWLLLFFLLPFLLVLKISVADPIVGQPPFTDLLPHGIKGPPQVSWDNYRFLFEDELYLFSYLKSVQIAFLSTLLCLSLGYPLAYAVARAPHPWRNALLLLIILPFWTSFLLRVYAWMGVLSDHGLVNHALLWLGLIERPLKILYTDTAVYLGILYSYLPFMVLPLYAALERMDGTLLEAAADLGATPWHAFRDITLPLSLPGIIAGSMLVFIPAIGEFVIPSLMGGLDSLMIGRTLYEEFFSNRDWPLSAAVATVLLLLLVLPIMVFQHYQVQEPGGVR